MGRGARRVEAACLAALLAGGGGCGGPGGPSPDPASPLPAWRAPRCPHPAGALRARSSFVFALSDAVDPDHAPLPRNPSEAIAFRLVYETLVEVNCDGAWLPGLAEKWETSGEARTWTFTLRDDAWFARDGARLPADARAVRAAWRETRKSLKAQGELPWSWREILLRDVRVLDENRLQVTTSDAFPDLPALLSRPEFAVALRSADDPVGAWPAGTRGRLRDPDGPAEKRDLVWTPAGDARGGAARIQLRVRPGADPRDLAASGADALLVRDRRSERYLASRAGLVVIPHIRSAEYFLLAQGRAPALTSVERRDLAAHATAALAVLPEGAPEPHRWGQPTTQTSPPVPPVIHYRSADADAGAIAARLAARLPGATARGASDRELHTWLLEGDGAPFVVRVPVPLSPGLERAQLEGMAPWLHEGGTALPLLDVRESLVTREGLRGISWGLDGVPRLEGAGWDRGRRR